MALIDMAWPSLAIFRPSLIDGPRADSRPLERLSAPLLRFAPAGLAIGRGGRHCVGDDRNGVAVAAGHNDRRVARDPGSGAIQAVAGLTRSITVLAAICRRSPGTVPFRRGSSPPLGS